MHDAVFVGKGDWRFPKVPDLERRVGAQDFGADVITINSFTREIDVQLIGHFAHLGHFRLVVIQGEPNFARKKISDKL